MFLSVFIQQSMRKEKLRKVVLCSITDYFTKPFKRIINRIFYLACSFAAQFQIFEITMMQEISKGETGNDKQLGMASYNIHFKNSFNGLVMNVTQNVM